MQIHDPEIVQDSTAEPQLNLKDREALPESVMSVLQEDSISSLFEEITNLHTIRKGNCNNPKVCDAIDTIFREIYPKFSLTKALEEGIPFEEIPQELLDQVTTVKLGPPEFPYDIFSQLARYCPNLTSIDLSGIELTRFMLERLSGSELIFRLEELNLSQTNLIAPWVHFLLNFSELQSLNLSTCTKLTDDAMYKLVQSGIEKLNLSHCPLLTYRSIEILGNPKCLPFFRLKELDISYCAKMWQPLLTRALGAFRYLEHLDISGLSGFSKNPLGSSLTPVDILFRTLSSRLNTLRIVDTEITSKQAKKANSWYRDGREVCILMK